MREPEAPLAGLGKEAAYRDLDEVSSWVGEYHRLSAAWSSYGIHWPLVELYLGIKPDAPAKTLAVVPDLPDSWKELSIDNLHVASDQIAVSVRRAGINYVTTVSAPVGWNLTIGYTFPANTQIKSVRLNNSPAAFQIANTNRGEEIHVQTNSGGTQEVRIQTK